LRFLLRPR